MGGMGGRSGQLVHQLTGKCECNAYISRDKPMQSLARQAWICAEFTRGLTLNKVKKSRRQWLLS